MYHSKMLLTALVASLIVGTGGCNGGTTLVDAPSTNLDASQQTHGTATKGGSGGDTASTTPTPTSTATPTPTTPAALAPAPGLTAHAARSADDLVNSIGTNVHLSYFGKVYDTGYSTIIKPRLQQLGVRHLRDEAKVVPSDGWMRTVYGRVSDLAGLGIRFNMVGLPALGDSNYTQLPQFNRLLQFLNPATVESFEGLNEHDYSGRRAWVAETRNFQKALFARVRSDARVSRLPVLGPSFGRPTNAGVVGDLSAYMDVGVMHSYPGGQVPMATYTYNVSNVRAVSGSHALSATESGYHTAITATNGQPGVSEAAMGKYVPRLFLSYFAAGVTRTFSYELIDQGTNTADEEQHFGLLRVNGSPKPAYTSLQNLIAVLSDPGSAFAARSLTYGLSGDTTNVKQMLFQKRDGRFYLALWQEVPSFNLSTRSDVTVPNRSLTIKLGTAARQIRVFQPYRSSTPIAQTAATATVTVAVPDHPTIIEVTP